ncbi:hypothetical protein HHUSO_G4208 [Huso huso]|uniref:Secreted protein n=1 Tax=Huso huso TaxID=61971 RepID=A0ABR1A4Z1_HUSHU
MRSLLLVCLLVVTLTVAIAAPTQEGSETGKGKKDDRTKGKVKRRNCVKKDDWTPTTNKPICKKRPASPGVVSLLDGDGEDAGGGQASTVWGRFDKGQEKKATSPPDIPIREKRQFEANPKRRPRPCLGCLSVISAKKEAPVTHTADPVLM